MSNTGADGTHGSTVNSVGGMHGMSIYNCPAKRFRCDVVYTNRPVSGAFRGYGAPQNFFAVESQMDDIAGAGMDPYELRRKNWVHVGDPLDIVPRLGERGDVVEIPQEDLPHIMSCGLQECGAQGTRAIGWEAPQRPVLASTGRPPEHQTRHRHGLGHPGLRDPLRRHGGQLDQDQRRRLVQSARRGHGRGWGIGHRACPDCRRGARRGAEDVIVSSSDTDITPFDVGAYASSTTYVSGGAVKKAAEAVRARIVARAARLLDLDDPRSVELHDRRAWSPDGRSISLGDVALNSLHTEDQEQIMGTASHYGTAAAPPFAVQLAEVEVDVETGQVTVKKLVTAIDCGIPINPVTASGQVEGAMLQASDTR